MKRILNKYFISLISVALVFSACSEDFLELAPKTQITGGGFFKSVSDVETYVNGLYGNLYNNSPNFIGKNNDWESDNATIYTNPEEATNMVRGLLNEYQVERNTWNTDKWKQLRGINYLFDNLGSVQGVEVDLLHFVGIARFFRANFYMGMVNRYSDAPWINTALASDNPDVYKGHDPRTLVVDSIMADLEFAAANIKPALGNRTRINKYTALTLLSRFCLYEGTYRRYHPELNLASTAEPFLQRAASAAEEIISSEEFSITGAGVSVLGDEINGAPGYQDLFHSMNLSGNTEVINWSDNTTSASAVGAPVGHLLATAGSLSRSLMETFLMEDGSRFTAQPDYDKKTFVEVFKNRDPRFAQVFAYPGFEGPDGLYRPAPSLGGYGQLKFYPLNSSYVLGGGRHIGAFVIFRYAEVLLNYAEAKAELGTLTPTDLERSIKLLRDRVEMPALNMAAANASIDPILEAQYPNVGGANKGVLLEIRRERRVELAGEGLRLWDLNRWYAGKLYGQHQQGIYIPALGAYDVTGDGEDDVILLDHVGDDYPEGLIPSYLHDENGAETQIYLEHETYGHVMMMQDKELSKGFKEPQYYYRPIPNDEILLNPNLTQPFGW
jgi:hypothetical protein